MGRLSERSELMKIYLIRHGETEWNHLMRFQGREDVPLNENGIAQARACGEALAGCGIQAVYTSPLARAHQTGRIIASCIGLSESAVTVLQELIERDLGEYSGQYIKDRADYFAIAAGTDAGGMEPFSSVLERMERGLGILSETGYETIAAVSHGAAINVLLAGLSDGRLGTGKTKLYNGGITILEGNREEGFRIAACNLRPREWRELRSAESAKR